MKPESMFRLTKIALVATAFLSSSFALAGTSAASPEMKAALAKAQEGPTELRRFVQRTKPIYQLDYYDVMAMSEQQRAAAAGQPVSVAQAERR